MTRTCFGLAIPRRLKLGQLKKLHSCITTSLLRYVLLPQGFLPNKGVQINPPICRLLTQQVNQPLPQLLTQFLLVNTLWVNLVHHKVWDCRSITSTPIW
jgi:hypothetical protein